MIVAPSIDLEGGEAVKRVRGARGTGLRLGDPYRLAEEIAGYGFRWVHVVDLDAVERGRPTGFAVDFVKRLARDYGLRVQYGGGVRSLEAGEELCSAGAERLVVGSAWLRRPRFLDELADATGCEVLAAVEEDRDGLLLAAGWARREGVLLRDAVRIVEKTRAAGYLYTQTWVEGTMAGPDLERVRRLRASTSRLLAYAGGVSSVGDLEALEGAGVDVAVVGMALYAGRIGWEEAARYA